MILKSPKIISTALLEINSCSQFQKSVKGKVYLLYSNNNFTVKLDFTNVTSDAPLASVCEDIKFSDLEQTTKLRNLSSLLLQIMSESANVEIL